MIRSPAVRHVPWTFAISLAILGGALYVDRARPFQVSNAEVPREVDRFVVALYEEMKDEAGDLTIDTDGRRSVSYTNASKEQQALLRHVMRVFESGESRTLLNFSGQDAVSMQQHLKKIQHHLERADEILRSDTGSSKDAIKRAADEIRQLYAYVEPSDLPLPKARKNSVLRADQVRLIEKQVREFAQSVEEYERDLDLADTKNQNPEKRVQLVTNFCRLSRVASVMLYSVWTEDGQRIPPDLAAARDRFHADLVRAIGHVDKLADAGEYDEEEQQLLRLYRMSINRRLDRVSNLGAGKGTFTPHLDRRPHGARCMRRLSSASTGIPSRGRAVRGSSNC